MRFTLRFLLVGRSPGWPEGACGTSMGCRSNRRSGWGVAPLGPDGRFHTCPARELSQVHKRSMISTSPPDTTHQWTICRRRPKPGQASPVRAGEQRQGRGPREDMTTSWRPRDPQGGEYPWKKPRRRGREPSADEPTSSTGNPQPPGANGPQAVDIFVKKGCDLRKDTPQVIH